LGYAAAYAAALAGTTDAFAHPWTLPGAALWVACLAHVQVHRVLRTNAVL
jgi:hypothetical protein